METESENVVKVELNDMEKEEQRSDKSCQKES